jgi:hypothetical protein
VKSFFHRVTPADAMIRTACVRRQAPASEEAMARTIDLLGASKSRFLSG